MNTPITLEPSVIFAHIEPLAILTLGIFVYAVLIFKFYKLLARRDLIKLKLNNENQHIAVRIFLYLLDQLVIVPVLIFFWFLIMTGVLLLFCNGNNGNIYQIMIISMAIVAAIRITSYYNQSLSEELAKLLPLNLLAIFLVTMDFSSFVGKVDMIKQMLGYVDKLIFYLIFAVVVELIMRIQLIIREVIRISAHNRQIIVSSSKHAKKSYNSILNGTFEELNRIREEEIAREKERIRKQQKSEEQKNNGKLDI
jgi:hypothetical protein